MSKYLVLGASGLLGSELLNILPFSHGTFFNSASKTKDNMSVLDLNDNNELELLLDKVKPEVVINCTGMANVDLCERFPEKSWRLNCMMPLLLAQKCSVRSIKFVHVSTDHFLNESRIKLKEVDHAAPINQYSFSKLNAERFIMAIDKKSLIIRANFFHFNFKSPKTFLDHLINGIKNGKTISSFSDVIFTPVSTSQLALYIKELVEIDFAGIVNISSSETLSKFEFHSAVLSALKLPTELHLPVALESIDLSAVRPHFMALDNTFLQKVLGVKVPSVYDMINSELLTDGRR
jgi:dTDP-4-dehydrorhamnose reductase